MEDDRKNKNEILEQSPQVRRLLAVELKLGSLFAGIGGFELAASWAGIEPVWSNEIDDYPCKVLRKNFNHRIIQDDIRNLGKHNLEPVDIISGGFPCQPFSVAGLRKGSEDNRYLWPEMLRIIRELQPSFVVGENVAGLLSMENGKTFDRILASLENEGYTVESFVIPACAVGAWHRRDRVWIIAYSDGFGRKRRKNNAFRFSGSKTLGFHEWDKTAPYSLRNIDGISTKLDKDRLKALGNAIVPQVAYELFKAIVLSQNN